MSAFHTVKKMKIGEPIHILVVIAALIKANFMFQVVAM